MPTISQTYQLRKSGQVPAPKQRPANWSFRTEAPSDWQYVAEICAERGEFAFSDIHAEYKRLAAKRAA